MAHATPKQGIHHGDGLLSRRESCVEVKGLSEFIEDQLNVRRCGS